MTKFKPRQMVEVIKDQPDFLRACAPYPEIGFRGMVVVGNKHFKHDVPEGKVAVRFSAKLLGHLDYLENPFVVVFVWAWAIKKIKPMKQPRYPYLLVINDTTATIREICEDAGVRYRIGPHQDGDRWSKGMYVHVDDLRKLKRWFRDTGQRAEAEWTQETINKARKK